MLLKLAHICHNSTDFEKDITSFIDLGFGLEWHEKDIANPSIKQSFFSRYMPSHSLALLVPKNGPRIEIVAQDALCNEESFLLDWSVSKDILDITVRTKNIETSVLFWTALGFKIDGPTQMSIRPMLENYMIRLELRLHDEFKTTLRGDARGYYAMAFLSNNVIREKARLEKLGIACTPIERVKVRENDIALFFSVGDNGEFVEWYSLSM